MSSNTVGVYIQNGVFNLTNLGLRRIEHVYFVRPVKDSNYLYSEFWKLRTKRPKYVAAEVF